LGNRTSPRGNDRSYYFRQWIDCQLERCALSVRCIG
jgi:hypothetical protein